MCSQMDKIYKRLEYCEKFTVATHIRATYVYQKDRVPILLEYRRSFKSERVFTIINGKAYNIESCLNKALIELVECMPQSAAIAIPHSVELEINEQVYRVEIVDYLVSAEKSDIASEFGVKTKLECVFEEQTYVTNSHEDVYTAFAELLSLLSKSKDAFLHLCPFCAYVDFHANYLFCLRDVPSKVLMTIRKLGKHAENANWYRGGIWGLDAFHTCAAFEKQNTL